MTTPTHDDTDGVVTRVDLAGEHLADRFRGRRVADRVMYGLSEAANHSMLWHASVIVVAVATHRRHGPNEAARWAIRAAIALGIEAALVNGPIKSLFRRSRPAADTTRPHHLRSPRTSSFPSGHATSAVLAASLLSDRSGHRAAWSALGAAVAASRVHVRVHHATDVLGGGVIGGILATVFRRWVAQGRAGRCTGSHPDPGR